MSITKNELLKGRDVTYAAEYTQEISDNLDQLLILLNRIRDVYGKPMIVSSGWRPAAVNSSTAGAASKSKHMLGLAADIVDVDGSLWKWVTENLELMKELGLYMEDRRWTPTWVHFGFGPPKSGKRIYIPSTASALAPNNWDGKYDHSFDD